jgi:hypothetical protein
MMKWSVYRFILFRRNKTEDCKMKKDGKRKQADKLQQRVRKGALPITVSLLIVFSISWIPGLQKNSDCNIK